MSVRSWHQHSRRLYHGNHQKWWKATTTNSSSSKGGTGICHAFKGAGRTGMDTMDRSSPQQPYGPRQLSRIAKLQKNIDAANMGNLCPDKGTISPQSSLAQNTRSKTTVVRPNCTTEVRTIEQEMVLACIETYVEVTQTPLQPAQLPQQKFPIVIMLNAVLNNNIGELMEICHLLRNPKSTKLWGKSYNKELG
jgi:hypothetical protein